ncbi:alpha/beta hydrolase [bacterium]|nr:alpha/beta hydrolase [bacterium]
MYLTLSDGEKIFYTLQGNPKGQPLLCLNGLSQSTVTWTALTSLLEKDFQVILMDFIFQGQSYKKATSRSLSRHADDVIELLDKLGLQQTLLAGISYGSIVSQNLLLRYPERIKKAALLATFAQKTARYREFDQLLHQSLELGGLEHLINTLYPFVLGPEFFENPPLPIPQLKKLSLDINEGQAIRKLMDALMTEEDYLSHLHKVNVSTLVIHGEYDFLCLPYMGKAVAEAIPEARFELLENIGHTLNVEAVPQLAKLLKGFLGA